MNTENNIPITSQELTDYPGVPPVPESDQCFFCEQKTMYGDPTCKDHRYCTHCACVLSSSDQKMLVEHKASIPECPACGLEFAYRMKMLSDKTKVEIPRIYFEYLNRMRLFIEPDENVSIETNQKVSEIKIIPLVDTMNHEQTLIMLKRMEAGCAAISLLLARDRKKIERDLKERDTERYNEALKERAKKIKPKKPKADEMSEPELILSKEQKALMKAIAGMTKFGMKPLDALIAMGRTTEDAEKTLKELGL